MPEENPERMNQETTVVTPWFTYRICRKRGISKWKALLGAPILWLLVPKYVKGTEAELEETLMEGWGDD